MDEGSRFISVLKTQRRKEGREGRQGKVRRKRRGLGFRDYISDLIEAWDRGENALYLPVSHCFQNEEPIRNTVLLFPWTDVVFAVLMEETLVFLRSFNSKLNKEVGFYYFLRRDR